MVGRGDSRVARSLPRSWSSKPRCKIAAVTRAQIVKSTPYKWHAAPSRWHAGRSTTNSTYDSTRRDSTRQAILQKIHVASGFLGIREGRPTVGHGVSEKRNADLNLLVFDVGTKAGMKCTRVCSRRKALTVACRTRTSARFSRNVGALQMQHCRAWSNEVLASSE